MPILRHDGADGDDRRQTTMKNVVLSHCAYKQLTTSAAPSFTVVDADFAKLEFKAT